MTDQVTLLAGDQSKKENRRQALLDAMRTQREVVDSMLQAFSIKDTHTPQEYIDLAQQIIAAVDQVLTGCADEDSLFLRNTVKPLKALREQAEALLVQFADHDHQCADSHHAALAQHMTAVYVLLFQTQGDDLSRWSQLLRSLGQYVLGRPVYATEDAVKSVIRARMAGAKEAYVKVAVPTSTTEDSTLSPRQDRYGNTLLSLPMGAIQSDHILEFVHGKDHYHFIKGQLVHVSSSTKRH